MSEERKDDSVMDQNDQTDVGAGTGVEAEALAGKDGALSADAGGSDPAAGDGFEPDIGGDDSPAPGDLKVLREKAAKADELWERTVRLTADFDNYKKRAARERQEAIRYSNEALLERLLPTLDHFEMAIAAAKQTDTATLENLLQGIEMVHSQLRTVLAEAGLEEIDAAGKPFDPNWHEAVSQQESAEHREGDVVQQIRKGYKLRDRLIRAASVVVAKSPES